MKIFNIEDGNKKVYVQLNDIMMMMQYEHIIPGEVMSKQFSRPFIVGDENRFNFVEYTDPLTIEYFEQCDWIPDYKKYRDLTEEEIIELGQQIAKKMNEIATTWNAMTVEQRKDNQKLDSEHEKLEFKMHSLAEIIWTKQGRRKMPFPIVPDCDGFVLDNEDCSYIVRQGINPTQVLIYRKDGNAIDAENEVISQGLIQAAESLLVDANLNTNEYFGDFDRTSELTKDGKYLVITFNIVPEKDVVKQVSQSNNEKMTLAKRIKNYISKKRSE